MLYRPGQALSQGDGSDFQWRCNWEATPPGSGPAWELGDDWLHAKGPYLPRLTLAAQQSWKNPGMLACVTDCRRSWKWGCLGRLVLEFKPRHSSCTAERIRRFWRVRTLWWRHSWCCQAPESRTCTSFPELWYPDWAEGDETVGILKDFSILMKTLSHASKSI